MKSSYRNLFMVFGVLAIILMLCTFDMKYEDLWSNLKRAGYWFPVLMLLWLFIYLLNATAWYLIIRDDKKSHIPFGKVYKFTISGFALNYATPMGLMGGEPYRIMELSPYVGAEKATSSVILYVMTHIFTHISFWFLSLFLYLALYPVDWMMGILLALIGAACLLAIYFFFKGYKNGMAVKTLRMLQHVPYIKRWAKRFSEEKKEQLANIDRQISQLHRQHKRTFYGAFSLEMLGRLGGCLEVWLILSILTDEVSFPACILIMAFSSLFSNLFFFSPMQLGVREGGLALAVGGLSLSVAFGVFTGLITRVRELLWIAIGVALMKVGNN